MKRIVPALCLLLALVFLSACGTTEHVAENTLRQLQVGETIQFGNFEQDNMTSNGTEKIEWTVLKVDGTEALLLSNKLIAGYEYNSKSSAVTWKDCTLRAWLNSTFYETAFSEEERGMVCAHSVTTESAQQKFLSGGSVMNAKDPLPPCDTEDHVFVLSVNELSQFFPLEKDRIAEPTAYVKLNCKDAFKWWTRSPGAMIGTAKFVDESGSTGTGGATNTVVMGVRPAIWIRFS